AAVVFDNDGLLLDTEPCWTRAQEAVFARRGRAFDLAAKQALVGTAPETAAAGLERLLDAPGRGRGLAAGMYAAGLDERRPGPTRPRPCARPAASSRSPWPRTRHAATCSRVSAGPGSRTCSTRCSESTMSRTRSRFRTSTCARASCWVCHRRTRWRSRTR